MADELAISQKAVNLVCRNQLEDLFHQLYSFFGIRVTPRFCQTDPGQWDGSALPGNGNHQIIDVFASKLPVGSIHAEGIFFQVQPVKNQPSQLLVAEGVISKEAFDSSITGLSLRAGLELFRHSVKVRRAPAKQGQNEMSKKYNAGLMPGEVSFKLSGQ